MPNRFFFEGQPAARPLCPGPGTSSATPNNKVVLASCTFHRGDCATSSTSNGIQLIVIPVFNRYSTFMFRATLQSAIKRAACYGHRRFCESATSPIPVTSRQFENIIASSDEKIGIVEIHRPREFNVLNELTLSELADAVEGFDEDAAVNVIILTGNKRVFATGNDIEELASKSYHSVRFRQDTALGIDRIAATKKPVIAAVSGFALGGGCELALAADIVIAAEDATFGQPEVQIGTLPTGGGTQRLVRAVGKAKAMELVLTGRQMSASEAESAGLVTRVAEKGKALKEAKDVAAVIASHSVPVVAAAKECVNIGFETTLSQGILFEKRASQSTFILDDRKEGMKAFIDQRKPHFSNR